MISKRNLLAGLTLVAALAAGAAHATVYTLSLTGTVADGTTGSFVSGGSTYYTYYLDLGLGAASPFTIVQGDEIQATITLDTPLVVPASPGGYQFVGVNFNGAVAPDGVSTVGMDTFSGGTGISSSPMGTNCGNCLSGVYGQPGPGSFSFSSLYADTTIETLTTPFLVDDVTLTYQVNTGPVPEPAAWTLMLIGVGAVGGSARLSRRGRRIPLPA